MAASDALFAAFFTNLEKAVKVRQPLVDQLAETTADVLNTAATFGGLAHDAPRWSAAAQCCQFKMAGAGVSILTQRSFLASHQLVQAGATGAILESDIEPVASLPRFEELSAVDPATTASLLSKVAIIKLNGGLGTGMGLDRAKSLLSVSQGRTFLDFIALQTEHQRATAGGQNLRFMLMNSFSTSKDTQDFLSGRYPNMAGGDLFKQSVEFMQGMVPKVAQDSLLPVAYPADPDCEWVPPGHGEIYIALKASGKLDALLAQGVEYIFVSNSDNLGATLDLGFVNFMQHQKLDFVMEVCERADADKKGGHLARGRANGNLLLREAAQCRKEDEPSFQDVSRHKYFNTNNLWVNLAALKAQLDAHGGVLPLPVIRNGKTVDPTNAQSQKVYQLESAMGAAIALFDKTSAIVVPRSRFAPVKTCADLLALRSDCYEVTPDYRIVLKAHRRGVPPNITLEDKHYKFVNQFESLVELAVPSLADCDALTVVGPIKFAPGVVIKGATTITNKAAEVKVLPSGIYTGAVNI